MEITKYNKIVTPNKNDLILLASEANGTRTVTYEDFLGGVKEEIDDLSNEVQGIGNDVTYLSNRRLDLQNKIVVKNNNVIYSSEVIYTAPSDGIACAARTNGFNNTNRQDIFIMLYINDIYIACMGAFIYYGTEILTSFVPVKKGDIIKSLKGDNAEYSSCAVIFIPYIEAINN